VAKTLTRTQQIAVRDHRHMSTDDLNRMIAGERSNQRLAEDAATKAQATLTTARKDAMRAKELADALETIVDSRN